MGKGYGEIEDKKLGRERGKKARRESRGKVGGE